MSKKKQGPYRGPGRPPAGGWHGEAFTLPKITRRSVAIFCQMRRMDEGSPEYDALDDALRAELRLKPWQFPTFEDLSAEDTGMAGTASSNWLSQARELHRQLERHC